MKKVSVVAVIVLGLGIVVVMTAFQHEKAAATANLAAGMTEGGPPSESIVVDPSSRNWRQLSDDVGLMLFTDRFGVLRARLYVRLDGNAWKPVAVDGFAELGPGNLPLG
jgi:hypothetical protein